MRCDKLETNAVFDNNLHCKEDVAATFLIINIVQKYIIPRRKRRRWPFIFIPYMPTGLVETGTLNRSRQSKEYVAEEKREESGGNGVAFWGLSAK